MLVVPQPTASNPKAKYSWLVVEVKLEERAMSMQPFPVSMAAEPAAAGAAG